MKRLAAVLLISIAGASTPHAEEELTVGRALLCSALFEVHGDPRREQALEALEQLGHMYSSAERQERLERYLDHFASYDNKEDERSYLAGCYEFFEAPS